VCVGVCVSVVLVVGVGAGFGWLVGWLVSRARLGGAPRPPTLQKGGGNSVLVGCCLGGDSLSEVCCWLLAG
jgi:hypothetical protein